MENQRVRLSKALLKSALLTLLEKKSLDRISIQELCATAQINRTTFYKHYGNLSDLLDDAIGDFFAGVDRELREKQSQGIDGLPFALDYLFVHRRTFNVIVDAIPSHDFADRLFRLTSAQKIFLEVSDSGGLTETQDKYLREFILQGIFAVLSEWLGSENPESPQEIAGILTTCRKRFLS